jgi:hypothetical protein
VLVAAAFVLLNVGLYEGARSRLVAERWRQLGEITEEKREDLRAQLDELRHEAEFVANQQEVTDCSGSPSPRRRCQVERELDQAAASFRLLAVEVLDPNGVVRATTSNGTHWRTPGSRRARASRGEPERTVLLTDPSDLGGPPVVVVARARRGREGEARPASRCCTSASRVA